MTVVQCTNFLEKNASWDTYIETRPIKKREMSPEEFDISEQQVQKDWEGNATLHFYSICMHDAVLKNNVDLICHIYKKNKDILDLGDKVGRTFIYLAIENDCFESALTLLELGANPNISTIEKFEDDPVGSTPLWKNITRYNQQEKVSIMCYFPLFDLVSSEKMIKAFLKHRAIAAPDLDEKAQSLLQRMQLEVETERTKLILQIDYAIGEILPQTIFPMIADYV